MRPNLNLSQIFFQWTKSSLPKKMFLPLGCGCMRLVWPPCIAARDPSNALEKKDRTSFVVQSVFSHVVRRIRIQPQETRGYISNLILRDIERKSKNPQDGQLQGLWVSREKVNGTKAWSAFACDGEREPGSLSHALRATAHWLLLRLGRRALLFEIQTAVVRAWVHSLSGTCLLRIVVL